MSATLVKPPLALGRQFAELPANKPFASVRNHLIELNGATLTRFANASEYEDAFVTFRYRDHEFRIDERYGKLRLSVVTSQCPERVIYSVLQHFSWFLSPGLKE